MAIPEQQSGLGPSEQMRELMTFLREESSSMRDHLRNQAEADRELLSKTMKMVALPFTAILAIVAVLGFKSFADLKNSIQSEARKETNQEITRMQSEIRDRLNKQFESQTLREIVKDAAKEQTQTTARPLIEGEVATQVKQRVDAEQGNILRAVTEQTQLAVKQMSPQINKLIKETVDSKVQTQVEPLRKHVTELKNYTSVQGLINSMNADDAAAFDALRSMPLDSLPVEERHIIASSLQNVFFAHNEAVLGTRSLDQPVTNQEVIRFLSDREFTKREEALGTLEDGEKKPTLLPKVVEMLSNDPSLNVRAAAHRVFNKWTGQKFKALDKDTTVAWWSKHQKEMLSSPGTK